MTDDGPPPPSPTFFLIALGRRMRHTVDDRLRDHGVALRHVSALGHLHRDSGTSYSELARRAGVTVQSMQTTVARLEAGGYVRRAADAGQGRRAELRVTPRGTRLLATADAVIRSVDDELLSGFSADERTQLEHGLARLFVRSG